MGLRKSASPRFTLFLPFISQSSSSTLMHLFICRGLLYSFEDIFFHAQQPDSCFSTLHYYVAPGQPICVCVCAAYLCVCVCIYKYLVQALLMVKKPLKAITTLKFNAFGQCSFMIRRGSYLFIFLSIH